MRTPIMRALVALALFAGVLSTARAAADVHFQLVKAEPADDAALTQAPDAIRLWFSQEPQMEGARIRLMTHDQQMVELGKVKQATDDAKMIMAPVASPLAPGAYTIAWRAMAQDGHVVTGELSFTVSAAR